MPSRQTLWSRKTDCERLNGQLGDLPLVAMYSDAHGGFVVLHRVTGERRCVGRYQVIHAYLTGYKDRARDDPADPK